MWHGACCVANTTFDMHCSLAWCMQHIYIYHMRERNDYHAYATSQAQDMTFSIARAHWIKLVGLALSVRY